MHVDLSDDAARFSAVDQSSDRRAKVRFGSVPELGDQPMAIEHPLNNSSLNASAAPMNQPDFTQPGFPGGGDIFLDDGRNLPRLKGVEVDEVLNGNAVRV